MASSTVISFRKSAMTKQPLAVYSQVTSSGKTVATVATATGYSQDDTEKYLGLLCDDALVTRSTGMRSTATYVLT